MKKSYLDNAVKEIQSLEDAKCMAAVDAQLLSGPWRRCRDEVGIVHVTGFLRIAQGRRTKCGIYLGYLEQSETDQETTVTCLGCLV